MSVLEIEQTVDGPLLPNFTHTHMNGAHIRRIPHLEEEKSEPNRCDFEMGKKRSDLRVLFII